VALDAMLDYLRPRARTPDPTRRDDRPARHDPGRLASSPMAGSARPALGRSGRRRVRELR
jgi:hypothetical protein